MKCNIRFYIFGVPDGFDIYLENQDDGNTKNYYQCFYDESIKEDTRFAIHRKVNGDVTYTYLKYHLISSGNRTNAFLGLSVLIEKGYYADVSSMYNLLDYAYGEMLKRELLLPTQNGLSAKFTVKTFEERTEDMKSIEAFVLNTLQSSDYESDFYLLDSTFTNEKPNACLKIPFQIYNDDAVKEKELNSLIVGKLKIYSWLSLSPDYQKKEQPPMLPGSNTLVASEYDEELNPETKQDYSRNFLKYQSDILTAYEMLVNEQKNSGLVANVKGLDESVKEILKTLNDYNKKQDDLKDLLDKYADIAQKLDTLISKLNGKITSDPGMITLEKNNKKSDPVSDDEGGKKREGGKWQRYAVAVGGLVAVCLLACFLYNDLRPNSKPVPSEGDSLAIANGNTVVGDGAASAQGAKEILLLDTLVARFEEAIQKNSFAIAIRCYNQIFKEYAGKDQTKIKECDSKLEYEFGNLIRNNDFEAASEWRDISSETFRNSFLNNLKKAFKAYIKNNKDNFSKKNELITKINYAKEHEYGYDGIDADLSAIEKLSPPSPTPSHTKYRLAIYLEGNKTASDNPFSTDTISLVVDKQYRIKNLDWVENAVFVQAVPPEGIDYFVGGKGKEAYVQLKALNEASVGTLFDVEYKNGSNTLFKLHFKVVNKEKKPNKLR